MLIINVYTAPLSNKVTTQAHAITSEEGNKLVIAKSYPKMDSIELSFFSEYKNILICNVSKSSMLSEVTIIHQ